MLKKERNAKGSLVLEGCWISVPKRIDICNIGCPFPKYSLKLGVEGVLGEIKKAIKRSVGRNRAQLLEDATLSSVGVDYGVDANIHNLENCSGTEKEAVLGIPP